MSVFEKRILEALFTQQRLQVIHFGKHHGEYSDAYVYAWENSVYPFFDDTDGSVSRKPHEHYAEFFLVSSEKVDELSKYLDDCYLSGNVPTFYELEDKYNTRSSASDWDRMDLIKICRYLVLSDSWDKSFWEKILTPTQYPSEASGIMRDYSRLSDVYFC